MKNQSRLSRFHQALIITILTVVSSPGLFGQAADAHLIGLVLDPSGLAISEASVEATNIGTNITYKKMSNEVGQYRFNNLPAGEYDVAVSREGFKTSKLRNVRLALNATSTANVTLEIGDVTFSVDVLDVPPLIDTTTSQVGTTYQAREAIDTPSSTLPLGVLNLALLSSGVSTSGGLGIGEGPSVGGQRPRNNSFMIEGMDNNRKDITVHNVNVPNEAVAEFSVLLNQYSAEFGNGTGGQFNTLLRSGGNDIHGSAFEYFQNRHLNAVDESLHRQGITSNRRLDSNSFGGALGGPVIRNRLFYYGLYQYTPVGRQGTASSLIYSPTAEGYSTLSGLPGISKTNLDVLQQYLAPSSAASRTTKVSGVEVPLGILPVSKPSYQNDHNWLLSGDYTASDSDQIRLRFIRQRTTGLEPTTLPDLTSFFQAQETTRALFSFSEFHVFNSTLLNEFRFGYQRFNEDLPSGDLTFPGLDAFPNITIAQDLNAQLGPFSTAPQTSLINQYQFVDNVTWTTGDHTLKLGFDARKYDASYLFIQRQRGDYGYNTLERYLLDLNPDVVAQRSVGIAPYNGDQNNFYLFVNDNYRLKSNLTVDLGLRWEYKGVPVGDGQWELNSLANVEGLIEFRKPKAQKTAFAPRIGIAYSPGRSGHTAIRAGFGIAYDKYVDNFSVTLRPPQVSSIINIDPAQKLEGFLANGGIPESASGTTCDTPQACRNATSGYLFDQQLPYSIQWNLGIEHVLGRDYTVGARYVGTRGVHLFTQGWLNVVPRVTPERHLPTYLEMPSVDALAALPYTLGDLAGTNPIKAEYAPYFNQGPLTAFQNRGNSIYHGLSLELSRRFARGLLFKGAYTWSHNIDDSSADVFTTLLSPRRPQDFQNMRAERSSSFLDRRHRFVLNWVWDTPWFSKSGNSLVRNVLGNYTLTGTYTYESPQYATVQSGVDSNLNLDAAVDRAIVNVNGVPDTGSGVIPIDRNGNTVDAGRPGIVAYVVRDPSAQYIVAGLGALATGGRQTLATRPINNWDIQVKKQFLLGETRRLQFAAQFFNWFNHPQYIPGYLNNVQLRESRGTRNNLIPSHPDFNRPDRVYASNARAVQLVARYQF